MRQQGRWYISTAIHALSACQGRPTCGLQTKLLDGVWTTTLVGLILVLSVEQA